MLRALGLTGELAGHAAAAGSRLARVLGVSGGVATVLTDEGPVRAGLGGGLLRAVAADAEQAPCAGDWVLLRDWPDRRVTLERVLPRHAALRRDLPGGPVVAANVDLLGVLVRPSPLPGPAALRRAAAMAAGAEQVLVLTGAEQVPDPGAVLARLGRLLPGPDGRPVPGVAVSIATGAGVVRLRELARGGTLALVGGRPADRAALCRALAGPGVVPLTPPPAPWLVALPGGGAVVAAGLGRHAGRTGSPASRTDPGQ